ncbi:hypothetical protein [Paraburkholderia sp. BCC1886]|uniref:hypothetical protein n=1 Tax=Paraburkholderia sp. BCC1886 TaxID=2562670 RepID=UPI001183F263|nr:hypothetical protein [Paraburkholderia sp. BCC1886]
MSLNPNTFTVHDISDFPFVLFNSEAAQPGYASQWEREMILLAKNDKAFVIVYDQHRSEEDHDDRKHRGIWLKHNKSELGRLCKCLISVEPDEARRHALKALSEMATKAFGIPHEVVATRDDALQIAHSSLGRRSGSC